MKKAVTLNVVVGIILALVVFAIVFSQSAIIVSESNSDDASIIRQCKLSALYLSKIDQAVSSGQDYDSFDCKTRTLTFNPEKEDINSFLADEMVVCWDIFGRGKLGNIFSDKYFNVKVINPSLDINLRVADKCFVCSKIEPPEEGFVINGFLDYLKSNDPRTSDLSYYTILYNDVKDEKNRFIYYENENNYFSVFNDLNNYNKPLYVVYSEGRGYSGVGVYTEDEFNSGKVCKGVLFGS